MENLGGGEFLRRNYATPPPKKPSRKTDPAPEKPERWNAAPVDDWETKLFGKQNILDSMSIYTLFISVPMKSIDFFCDT